MRSISTPDEATLREEGVGSMCGLGLDILGIYTLILAARYRTAANSGTLPDGLAKIHAAREHDRAPVYAVASEWKEQFLYPSMAHGTMEVYDIVCRLDRTGRFADSPNNNQQKAATTLIPDEIQELYIH